MTYQKSKPGLVCDFAEFGFKLSIYDVDLLILYRQMAH
jgi:hypothetical protein